MHWAIIDKDYVQYLKQFDNNVGNINYGDRIKLHIGVLFTVNDFQYYVPISSPKPKHLKMSNNIDFHKIVDTNGKLYAVINLNNMIPVPPQCATVLTYNHIDNYRHFSDLTEKNNYIYLLQKEMAVIQTLESTMQNKAKRLYQKCIDYPDSTLAKRCCNFQLLETKSSTYRN